MTAWQIAAVSNGVIAVAYVAIGVTIFRGVFKTGQQRSNPLAVATGLIFLSCGVGHGVHLEHLFAPDTREASRIMFDVHMAWVDGVTAVIAVLYWSMRSTFGRLLGSTMYIDRPAREAQRDLIGDELVQHLAAARFALAAGDTGVADASLRDALAATSALLVDLDAEIARAA